MFHAFNVDPSLLDVAMHHPQMHANASNGTDLIATNEDLARQIAASLQEHNAASDMLGGGLDGVEDDESQQLRDAAVAAVTGAGMEADLMALNANLKRAAAAAVAGGHGMDGAPSSARKRPRRNGA